MQSQVFSRFGGVALIISAVLLAGTGCNNAAPPADTPPDVPPQSTLVIDFSDFESSGTGRTDSHHARVQQPIPGSNFFFAAGNLVVWSAVITVTLAIPVAAFTESFNHEPEQLEDDTWQWSYSFAVSGVQHTARLQADVDNDGVDWTMLISKEGDYTDFVWFTGHSNLAVTEGSWTLNRAPLNGREETEPFILIEWARDVEDETLAVKYTNITPDAPENGGYIEYGLTNSAPYDAYYTIASAGDDHTINIEFNTEAIAGRVRDEIHFNDTDWHCWGEDLQNSDCP